MKQTILLLGFLTSFSWAFAQSPEMFNYQGVARDNGGNVLANQNISLRLFLISGNSPGTVQYSESHAVTTNGFGLFNVAVGSGITIFGSFSSIDWGSNDHYIKVDLDPAGGTSYVTMGTSQLLSVPYAMYAAETSGGLPSATGGQTLRHDGSDWVANSALSNDGTNVGIGTTTPDEKLDVDNGGSIQVDGEYTYETAKTHYQSFAWNSFRSAKPQSYLFGQSSAVSINDRYGVFVSGNGTSLGYAEAPIHLPDGAKITELKAWVWDNDGSAGATLARVQIKAHTLGTDDASPVSPSLESDGPTAIASVQELTTTTNITIDNSTYAYSILFTGAQLNDETRLYGVRLTYTVNQAD